MRHPNFEALISHTIWEMKSAPLVKTQRWQGVDISTKPDMETYEILNHSSTVPLNYELLSAYRDQIKPDLPWADDHFEERVCGYPLNPGTQWAKWRLAVGADAFRSQGQFNHNYMERLWPRYARKVKASTEPPGDTSFLDQLEPHRGILYEYGDLRSLVELIAGEPDTRQAYLPIWFPEDTGVVHGDRAPCTLGWHFIIRNNQIHCTYYLRSCDITNHWRNDLYMAVRLLLWVLDEARDINPSLLEVSPGTLTTHITSLHCFRGEFHKL